MSYQIFFKDSGVRLSSVKSTCAGCGIVADAARYGSVAAVEGDGSVYSAAGDCSAVGGTRFSGGLGTGADGALHL